MKTSDTLTTERETDVPVYTIDGGRIRAWPDFVASMNALIPQAQWQGHSLDALDDILYGGYGTPNKFIVVWRASEVSRQALGPEETLSYFKNMPAVLYLDEASQINPLAKTLFEVLVEIFEGHENIELRLE